MAPPCVDPTCFTSACPFDAGPYPACDVVLIWICSAGLSSAEERFDTSTKHVWRFWPQHEQPVQRSKARRICILVTSYCIKVSPPTPFPGCPACPTDAHLWREFVAIWRGDLRIAQWLCIAARLTKTKANSSVATKLRKVQAPIAWRSVSTRRYAWQTPIKSRRWFLDYKSSSTNKWTSWSKSLEGLTTSSSI